METHPCTQPPKHAHDHGSFLVILQHITIMSRAWWKMQKSLITIYWNWYIHCQNRTVFSALPAVSENNNKHKNFFTNLLKTQYKDILIYMHSLPEYNSPVIDEYYQDSIMLGRFMLSQSIHNDTQNLNVWDVQT